MREIIKRHLNEYITESEYLKLIGEGLIKTHAPEKVVNKLGHFLNNQIQISYVEGTGHGDMGFIQIKPKNKTKEKIDQLISLMNNMGYFFSSWFKEGEYGFMKPDEIKDYHDIFIMRFEPKFDVEYLPESKYLYHVTSKKILPKILKLGLTPKTKSKLTNRPDRIYLAITENSLDDISELMDSMDFIPKEEQIKLQINLEGLPIFLRRDGQFEGGVYTTDNIPPNKIKII